MKNYACKRAERNNVMLFQNWIDGSGENGVIYMSFGSVLRTASMTPEKRQMVLEVLESLSPIRVIWKWESDEMVTTFFRFYIDVTKNVIDYSTAVL